jgi:hypothetical protein
MRKRAGCGCSLDGDALGCDGRLDRNTPLNSRRSGAGHLAFNRSSLHRAPRASSFLVSRDTHAPFLSCLPTPGNGASGGCYD